MPQESHPSRRRFIQTAGTAGAISALSAPRVFAASGEGPLKAALVGCGGRGTGAAANALNVKKHPVRVVAMADVYEQKMRNSVKGLENRFDKEKFDAPEERRFLGLDAYKQAMDCLEPGDIVILATPPAFRWVHFTYAIEKGLNVFMEKPVTVDAPTSLRMLELGKKAEAKNLKVGVGLMVRHCRGRRELYQRIRDGEIGELITLRAYRMHHPVGSAFSGPMPKGENEMKWQIARFHSFLWASGGLFSDFYIHQVDECCWMKDQWPVSAIALGGRHYRGDAVDQNFDTYHVEYRFADGARLYLDGRTMRGCHTKMSSYGHGSKGSAIITTNKHTPGKVRTYQGHTETADELIWAFPQPEENPYQLEWDDLVEAIVEDQPYNEVERGVMASLVTSMGRMAAHTGQEVTLEQMKQHDHEFAPGLDQKTFDDPAPLVADEDGKYPVPSPGFTKKREYGRG